LFDACKSVNMIRVFHEHMYTKQVFFLCFHKLKNTLFRIQYSLTPPAVSLWEHQRKIYNTLCTGSPGVETRAVEPEPRTLRWWSRSLKFGFRFHRHTLRGSELTMILVFNGPNRSGTGAKNF